MRICLLGENSGSPDEGMAKIATELGHELAVQHDVVTLSPRRAFQAGFWTKIRSVSPHIIHYIPGPSLKSFALTKALSLVFPSSKTIMSAPLPQFPSFAVRFLRLLKPDLILAQSRKMERAFTSWGLPATYLPLSGVNADVFRPASNQVRRQLRRKHELPLERFIALHVGHLKSKRNVQALKKIQSSRVQTLVVGSTSTGIESRLVEELLLGGCLLITEYVEKIEELYRLSDCYIFPTPPENKSASIEIPLSVLEAAACGLPIISTRFGGVFEVFEGVKGVEFIDGDDEIPGAIQILMRSRQDTETRERAIRFTWRNISLEIDSIYQEVLFDNAS